MRKISVILTLLFIISACKPVKYSDLDEGLYAEIITNKGAILVELYANKVPMTVANFVSLAEGEHPKLLDSLKGKNFYKNIIFHRVVNNFVIQAGGYDTQGRKPTGYTFGDEFPKNENGQLLYKHNDAGILSMANGGVATNNSQFFITHRPIPHLDDKHSVFGKTIVNPNQLKELKLQYKDSLKLQNAIDSTRMAVVKSITQNDTILSLDIIRIGQEATNFNAANVFEKEDIAYNNSITEQKKAKEELEEKRYTNYLIEKEKFYTKMGVSKATKTSSGLQILKLKKTKGKKVSANEPVTANYILYVADGKKIQSSYDVNGKPLTFRLDDQQRPMIAGFEEGVLTMREGEKSRLFIPYYIGYGEDAFGPFPAKADLVFEVEILKVGK
ncbi:peptidylprolyl isomerase [Polaribacter sp. WD7]|uniref:peptidylprolyl isomerase n=1 Tax=Polaribacter sp. WD7 TaxID=2269061 RepID=UPI000DF333E6|nr:peptidylprolyl isomerase [Polaribacter sp. WD7]RCS27118.1 peptidylprolyl isomerase [Polaribacter sp. WD7]